MAALGNQHTKFVIICYTEIEKGYTILQFQEILFSVSTLHLHLTCQQRLRGSCCCLPWSEWSGSLCGPHHSHNALQAHSHLACVFTCWALMVICTFNLCFRISFLSFFFFFSLKPETILPIYWHFVASQNWKLSSSTEVIQNRNVYVIKKKNSKLYSKSMLDQRKLFQADLAKQTLHWTWNEVSLCAIYLLISQYKTLTIFKNLQYSFLPLN